LTKQRFLIHLLLIGLFFALVLFLTMQWLKLYTNHGQKLELPNYIGKSVDGAIEDARDKTFEIIVNDSIHRVGKPGGLILDQNPKGGSIVKENRKIYITITKHQADVVMSEHLTSELYGGDFHMIKSRLENQEFKTAIKSTRYDRGAPNHILEVWYNGNNITDKKGVAIEKGTTISFVLSKNDDGELDVPNLVCQTLEEATLLLDFSKLSVADIIPYDDEIVNQNGAFIYKQDPPSGQGRKITMGSGIRLFISKDKPSACN